MKGAFISIFLGKYFTRSRNITTFTNQGTKGNNVDKILAMRSFMENNNLDALIVPTDDPHMSEYTAPYFGRREFLSGFTGSAGTALITKEKSLLFTDGRYHKQAELELGPEWTLMKLGIKGIPTLLEYISSSLQNGAIVGIDSFLHSADAVKKMKQTFKSKNIIIKPFNSNPVDIVWSQERPPLPNGILREHPIQYAGKATKDKLNEVRDEMINHNVTSLILSSLDEIAWLLNFRGADVPCNPVSLCYAIIGHEAVHLFIDENKVPSSLRDVFQRDGIVLKPYNDIIDFIEKLGICSVGTKPSLHNMNSKIWFDSKTTNYALYNSIPAECRFSKESPIVLMKASKNSAELAGMRACHLRDGAAVVEYLSWLDDFFNNSNNSSSTSLNEVDIDIGLTACRARYGDATYLGQSFATIAGVNSNSAIMHYRATKDGCAMLTSEDLLLLDSGAQYTDGTTDVTRTIHMGTPTAYQREMFTRVLKGHIAIDNCVYPAGTAGCMLDSFARQYLWEIGKDYLHGTGHGVGAALNVHEGPHRISSVLPTNNDHGLKAGMIVSNEPGYYEEGNFGIRIENLLEVIEKPDLCSFGGKGFLGFRKLTYIPIQQKMIALEMLTERELNWLNQYHTEVKDKIGPLLTSRKAREWLNIQTRLIKP